MKAKTLIRRWLREARRFEKETLKTLVVGDRCAANRYEGIARGYRWAAGDLRAALKSELERKP